MFASGLGAGKQDVLNNPIYAWRRDKKYARPLNMIILFRSVHGSRRVNKNDRINYLLYNSNG